VSCLLAKSGRCIQWVSIVTVTVTICMLFIFFINFCCCIVASISSASAGAMLLLLAMRRMFMLLFGFVEVVLARSLHFSNRLMLIKCFVFCQYQYQQATKQIVVFWGSRGVLEDQSYHQRLKIITNLKLLALVAVDKVGYQG